VRICLEGVGKRYRKQWVFRELTQEFDGPGRYAILGRNGAGKSTLLRLLGGLQSASEGKVTFEHHQKNIAANDIYRHVSLCAPGLELVEELTLRETLEFHFAFKSPLAGLTVPSIIELAGLQNAACKPLADFSSGMKQRVKLAQALFSDTAIVLLDEPCTNLDDAGVEQYNEWVSRFGNDRLVIVASNDEREYRFCEHRLELSQ
jgi:ABC-type multidrug transport system ATPase subunit